VREVFTEWATRQCLVSLLYSESGKSALNWHARVMRLFV